MRDLLPAILSLLMAVAGWYYMFYSRAAQKLSWIEAPQANRRRVWLRRVNGMAMFLLAVCFFAGFQVAPTARAFVLIWAAVLLLLCVVVLLGLSDVRLTWKLREGGPNKRDGSC